MQPWSPPENAIVLTDLLRPSPPQHHQQYQPQQQRYDYVKQEPQLVPSRPRIVELPPLLPPRAPMLPAFSDVLRTTSPQHFQHENQETAASVHLYGVVIDKSSYTTSTAVVTEQYPTTFSATFMIDHGLCVRHGGGKRCTAEGCTARAKHFGRCWRHGGSVECKAPECCNRAKSRGFCWSHGGGTKCKTGACEKIAISNGLCWAHGGGKRCIVPGCRKQAYERTCNYCNSHFQQYQLTALELARHNPSV
uniref:WRKY19-like zinc finger domain-containing protein n=1 Tax=Phytophthora ramorum TaxID=164328 RepID=H3HDV8_PHYRM